MEYLILIIAAIAIYFYQRISKKLNRQGEQLTDLKAQIARLNLVISGEKIAPDSKPETDAPNARTAKPGPWGEPVKTATLAKSVDRISMPGGKDESATSSALSSTDQPDAKDAEDELASISGKNDEISEIAARISADRAKRPENSSGGAIESLIGGQWAVWVGGIALAFGGIFLVRYSIEAGLLGPKIRLTLAALFGLVLLVAGEFIRRRSISVGLVNLSNAYIPGILTAVGSMVLFAVTYGAYALYGFISPSVAFILLAIISLATLALALIHGPSLAALGLLASYLTPALVATTAPNYTALFGFLLVVTFASLLLARLRQWGWLIVASAVGALLWAILPIAFGEEDVRNSLQILAYLVGLGAGYTTVGAFWNFGKNDNSVGEENSPADKPASSHRLGYSLSLVFAALGLVLIVFAYVTDFAPSALLVAAIVVLVMWAGAWFQTRISALFTIGAAIALAEFAGWWLRNVQISIEGLNARSIAISTLVNTEASSQALAISLAVVALVIVIGALGVARLAGDNSFKTGAAWWGLPLAIVPVTAYTIVWLATGMQGSLTFGIVGVAGVLLLMLASELVLRRVRSLTSQGLFEVLPLTGMVAGGAALSIATLLFYFDGAVLVVSLSVLALAMAALTVIRPVQALRYGAAAAVATAIARVVIDPLLGMTPAPTLIFNAILPAYGLPTIFIGLAAWFLAKWGKDAPQRFFEGAAVLFAALLFTLQIRHGMNGGDIYARSYTLAEQAANTITALVMSGAMMRLDDRSPSVVFRTIMQALGYLSLIMVIVMHGIIQNPLLTNESTGTGSVFNLLMIAYLLPGIIAAIVHWMARKRRSATYVTTLEMTAWLLLSAFVALTIRRAFVGAETGLYLQPIEIAEAYSHSIAALALVAFAVLAYKWLFAGWKSRILPLALLLASLIYLGGNFGLFMPYQPGIGIGQGVFFNLLLPGFLLPAILYLLIRQAWKNVESGASPWLSRVLGALALISIFAWATFMVRQIWHNDELYKGALFSTETYTYSAVWLALGVVILLVSGWRNARDLRIASAVVIFAAVIKVFLFDMSALEGVLRALSFIGLGVVLIGIGLFYQRLLFKD